MAFTCPECGMTSHNPNDEREGYCGNCHRYTGRDKSRGADDVKVIDMAREGIIMPPADPNVCQLCEREHPDDMPHDRDNLGYQYRFYHDTGRWPTWADAVAHCTPEVKQDWLTKLGQMGVPAAQIGAAT